MFLLFLIPLDGSHHYDCTMDSHDALTRHFHHHTRSSEGSLEKEKEGSGAVPDAVGVRRVVVLERCWRLGNGVAGISVEQVRTPVRGCTWLVIASVFLLNPQE